MIQESRVDFNNQILHITLAMLPNVMQYAQKYQNTYQNSSYQYVCYVARVIQLDPILILTDQTGIASSQIYRSQFIPDLQLDKYYQCLSKIRVITGTSSQIQIFRCMEVPGNWISLHMMRVMKNEFLRMSKEREYLDEKSRREHKDIQKLESIYFSMKKWVERKKVFSSEDMEQEMKDYSRAEYQKIVTRFQEQQIIGNMGTHYVYL